MYDIPGRATDIWAGSAVGAKVEQKAGTWQGRQAWIDTVSMDGLLYSLLTRIPSLFSP